MTGEMTVVIPTLGRSSLERAVSSVVAQSRAPSEIIVVGNGSHPISEERIGLLKELGGSIPLHVLSLPPFSGPSMSRNIGAWEAVASYIAFLDDDDEFDLNYIEIMWAQICEHNPDVLYGALVWPNSDGSIRSEKRISAVPAPSWFDRLYRQENPGFGGQNLVVRRELFFELGGFSVDLPSGEDRAFAMAALSCGSSIVCVDDAQVFRYDPSGYRAGERPDKWVTNLKLIGLYWDDVSWRSRFRSVWRWLRSAVTRQRRALTARSRRWLSEIRE